VKRLPVTSIWAWLLLSLLLPTLPGCAGTAVGETPAGDAASAAPAIDTRGEQARFIDDMVAGHGMDRARLNALFGKVEFKQRIIELMTTPAEAKPWRAYRPIFVNGPRISGGVGFWRDNADTLARAERDYGVPAEIIVAIIGVETRYGGNMGGFRVIDALATLAFGYPKRAPFFRAELEHFLLLADEEHLDPLSPKGSYAGAMGRAQFMPSSYRNYAVDFDGDGRRDLFGSVPDAIGSVANYLKQHGWTTGRPVTTRAKVRANAWQPLLDRDMKPEVTVAAIKQLGVTPDQPLDDALPATLMRLDGEDGDEFWIGTDNFYVITRYNHSIRYAMAVYQLGQEIRAQRH
jgi:membrane-bound lytic murein transglycosylase B